MTRCLSVIEFLFIVAIISSSLMGGSTLMSMYSDRSDGISQFSTSSKCSVHLLSCSLSDVSIFPSLYLIIVQLLYGPPTIAK